MTVNSGPNTESGQFFNFFNPLGAQFLLAIFPLYEKSAKGITLSAPLHEVENHMNQIKLSVLNSEKSVTRTPAQAGLT